MSELGDRRRIGDSEAAALLARYALLEIREMAWRCSTGQEEPSAYTCERIHLLAHLAHNLPGIAREAARWLGGRDRKEIHHVWSTAGPDGQAWILDTLESFGCAWTPPSDPQPVSTEPPVLRPWQKVTTMVSWWPVHTPRFRKPLPRSARVLKEVSTDQIVAIHEEAKRRRLGMGADSVWLRAHLDPLAKHYLVPDPASYYWPTENRRWWQCRELLRMKDGGQVTTSVAILPETFTALPDTTMPGREQRRFVHLIRATRYHLTVWGKEHKAECGQDQCGYDPAPPGQ